jgi:hypothetical protein
MNYAFAASDTEQAFTGGGYIVGVILITMLLVWGACKLSKRLWLGSVGGFLIALVLNHSNALQITGVLIGTVLGIMQARRTNFKKPVISVQKAPNRQHVQDALAQRPYHEPEPPHGKKVMSNLYEADDHEESGVIL